MINSLPQLVDSLPFLAYVMAAIYLLVITCVTIAVFKDAQLRQLTAKGTFLVGPLLWAAIVFLTGGFTGALAYWLIHYSALRYMPREQP